MRIRLFRLFLLLLVLPIYVGFSHDTDNTFYKITKKENLIEIETTFTWSIRNALLEFKPSLEKSTQKTAFEKAFYDYVKSNLILIDNSGIAMKLLTCKELKTNSHTHGSNYLISFQGNDIKQLTNTILFNIHKQHTNIHNITTNSKETIFKTTNSNPTIDIQKQNKFNYLWALLLPLGFLLLITINKQL